MFQFMRAAIVCVAVVFVVGCAQTSKGTVRQIEGTNSTSASASDVASVAVLGAIAVPVGIVTLPYTALSALRGEDVGLSELGLKEKYGMPTTVFACANDYFKLWHYHFETGDNQDVYFFIFNDGYVQDVQFVNKWESLCVISKPIVE